MTRCQAMCDNISTPFLKCKLYEEWHVAFDRSLWNLADEWWTRISKRDSIGYNIILDSPTQKFKLLSKGRPHVYKEHIRHVVE